MSTEEHLRAESDCVFRGVHGEPDRPWVVEDLIVVASQRRLIPEEVDVVQTLPLQHLQTQPLVPALWEDVEADETAPCEA